MTFSQKSDQEKYDSQKNKQTEDLHKKGPRIGQRHIQVLLLLMVMFVSFATRGIISIVIVAMTDSTTSKNPDVVTFNWTNTNVIISSFSWGYVVFQVVGAHFMNKHGVKWFVLVAMLVNAISFTMIPQMAIWFGSMGVIVCRIVQGLFQGIILPSILTVLGKWVPDNERARLVTVALSGIILGSISGELVTGYISASWAGWPAVFYIFGGLSFGVCVVWLVFAHNSPATHPTITRQEKEYIEKSLGVEEHAEPLSTPWRAVMTSLPFWALFICTIAGTWSTVTLISETPTYLSKILGFDIKSNGLLSSGRGIVGWLASLGYSFIADYLLEKKYISTSKSRKLFQTLATIPPIICLVSIGLLPKGHNTLCVVLLFLISLFQSGVACGAALNILDLAPNHSGIIQAMTNSFSGVVSIFAPLYVQFTVTDLTNLAQWRQIFLTSASVYLVGGLVFIIFGSAERQWWDPDRTATREGVSEKRTSTKSRKISSISAIESQYII